jgi:hypothetical protein
MSGMLHPSSTDESLGMRLHEVNRHRAVERATERLRYGLKADWHYLTQDDIANLTWLLGEVWSARSRDEWDELHFSKIGLHETRLLVGHADRLRRHGTRRVATIDEVCAIVSRERVAALAN